MYAFILGAPDPECAAIENILRHIGALYLHASYKGRRVRPDTAYQADAAWNPRARSIVKPEILSTLSIALVECGGPITRSLGKGTVIVDHHRPGDPGFDAPPERYWEGSSIGQVHALLGIPPSNRARLIAAADHCLTAAYHGGCPGVDPNRLAVFRAQQRAKYAEKSKFTKQGILSLLGETLPRTLKYTDVLRAWGKARDRLDRLPRIMLAPGIEVIDSRRQGVPELPEATAQLGVPVLTYFKPPRGLARIGLLGAGEGTPAGTEPVVRFLAMARSGSILGTKVDAKSAYGSPVRGYAGVYLPE